MGIFDFFSSKKNYAEMQSEEKLAHLKVLIALALSDGNLDDEELEIIRMVCSREGMSSNSISEILNNPDSIDYIKPSDDETRIKYLKDMVFVMMVDGKINPKELALCKLTALNLGFKHEIIDVMIKDIIEDLENSL